MALQLFGQFQKLEVDMRHGVGQLRDGERCADAGDDVFTLGVGQVLAEDQWLACGGIARETDAGAAVHAAVAEDHGLHRDGGTHRVGDAVELAVKDRAIAEPRTEDRLDRHEELRGGVLREGISGAFVNDFLEGLDYEAERTL